MEGLRLCGIRGAITVEQNTKESIGEAARELVTAIMRENDIAPRDIVSVLFSATADLNADFPATAVRELPGWNVVPMFCVREMEVPGGLAMCIRVLIHAYKRGSQEDVRHVYLRGARILRPDLIF